MIFFVAISCLFLEGTMPLEQHDTIPKELYIVRGAKNVVHHNEKECIQSKKVEVHYEAEVHQYYEVMAYKTKLAALLATYRANGRLGIEPSGLHIEFWGEYQSVDAAIDAVFSNVSVTIFTINSAGYKSAWGYKPGIDHYYRDFGNGSQGLLVQDVIKSETISLNQYIRKEITEGRLHACLFEQRREKERKAIELLKNSEAKHLLDFIFWRWMF